MGVLGEVVMASWKFEGLDDYVTQLNKLSDTARETVGEAIYKGAGLVARACVAEIQALPVSNQYKKDDVSTVTSFEKAGLLEGFGISHEQEDGFYRNVKLGFAGYNKVHTHKYRNGQPNAMIARSINSGSSWRRKNPFMDRATRSSKSDCEETMRIVIETKIQKIVQGGQ